MKKRILQNGTEKFAEIVKSGKTRKKAASGRGGLTIRWFCQNTGTVSAALWQRRFCTGWASSCPALLLDGAGNADVGPVGDITLTVLIVSCGHNGAIGF